MSAQAPTFTRVHLRKRLSDSELTGELASCARRERAALAALLGYLGQFDERKVYAAAGFTSTTAYVVYHFGWSFMASTTGANVTCTECTMNANCAAGQVCGPAGNCQ